MHRHPPGCSLLPEQTLAEVGVVVSVAEAESALLLPTAIDAPHNLS